MSDVTPPPGMEQYVSEPPSGAIAPPQGMEEYVADATNERMYGSPGQKALTAIEGAASSIPGADYAANAMRAGAEKLGINPDIAAPDIASRVKRRETNPITSTAGSMVGGAALLHALPVGGVLEEGLGAGKLATAAGYGAEGALLAGTSTVSDMALGDPDLNAQKILTRIGMGTVLGMGLGVGGRAISGMLGKSGAVKGSVSDVVQESETKAADQATLMEGLSKLKKNAPEIISAAQELGAPVTEGMVSDNQWVQRFEDSLVHGAPTYSAIKKVKLYEEGYNAVENNIKNIVGESEENGGISKAQFGQAMEQSLSSNIAEENKPISALYDAVREETRNIAISPKSLSRIAQNVMKLEVAQADPAAERIANMLASSGEKEIFHTVDGVKMLRKIMTDSISPTASRNEKFVISEIQDRLKSLEENTITKYAENIKNSHAERLASLSPEQMAEEGQIWQTKIRNIETLLEQKKAADAAYSPFINKVKTLAKYFGKKNISGAQGAIDFITEDLTPEKLAQKATQKGNSEFTSFFEKNFPEQFELMKQYQRSELRNAAVNARTGEFDSRKFIKSINKMEPEMRKALFAPEELKKLSAADTYLKSLPEDFNPSHTAHEGALRSFYESPRGSAIANVRDYGIDQFIKSMVKLPVEARPDPIEAGQQIAKKFNKIDAAQKIINETNDKIKKASKSIFNKDAIRGAVETGIIKNISFEQKRDRIQELASNINALGQHMSNHTVAINDTMPNLSSGIHNAMIASLSFLNEKLPKAPPPLMLSKPWAPNEMQKERFNKYYEAVNNPIGILHQVREGSITSEALEAVSATHPGLLNDMRTQVMANMKIEKAQALPYSVQLSLSKFLGQPLDSSMLMNVKIANQQTFNMQSQQPMPQQQSKKRSTQNGLSKLNVSGRSKTETQDLEEDNV